MKNERMNIFLCEFSDKSLEKDFLNYDIKNAKRYLSYVVFGIAFFYALFTIPDFILLKDSSSLIFVLALRMTFFTLLVILSFLLAKIKSGYVISLIISFFEIICAVIIIIVFFVYKDPDFLVQSYGVMLFIIVAFLIPNRLINIIIVTILTVVGFSVMAQFKYDNIPFSNFSASVVYNFLAIILSCIYTYRNGYTKRKQYLSNKELVFLTYNDPLTGLSNKLKMNKEIERLLRASKTRDTFFSLILFDIDDFKIINDTYGHIEGDRIISELGGILLEKAGKEYISVRWGGEEFVVIMPNKTSAQAAEFAEELRKAIEAYTFNKNIKLTCSFGVIQSDKNDTVESVIIRADNLLYNAKNMGKNIVIA